MLRLLSLAFSVAGLLTAITGATALGLNPNKSNCAVVLENGRLVNIFAKNKRALIVIFCAMATLTMQWRHRDMGVGLPPFGGCLWRDSPPRASPPLLRSLAKLMVSSASAE